MRSARGSVVRVSLPLAPLRVRSASRARSADQRKCTEPVAPSSGFPTDRRRSDCRSESHQPRTLRTRCIADSRVAPGSRQGVRKRTCRKLRSFLFTQASTALQRLCSKMAEDEKRAEQQGSATSSPSRERFRPPSRRTFRFRVVLLGGLRPTGAPCSAQAETYDTGRVRSRGSDEEFFRSLRTNPEVVSRSSPARSSTPRAGRAARARGGARPPR